MKHKSPARQVSSLATFQVFTEKVLFHFKAFFLAIRHRCPFYFPSEMLLLATPASRLGSEQAPWQQQHPCASEWRSWFAGTRWAAAAPEAEPPQSCWGQQPWGSWWPAGAPRSCWGAACVYVTGCLRCCNREVPVRWWLLLVAAGKRWSLSPCLRSRWESTDSGSWVDGGLVDEDLWLWRTACRSWTQYQSRCCSLPTTLASAPEHPPCGREKGESERGAEKAKTHHLLKWWRWKMTQKVTGWNLFPKSGKIHFTFELSNTVSVLH